MDLFFTQDSYDTPEETPRAVFDRLFLGTRTYFVYRYSKVVLKASSLAKRGLYDDEAWARSSYQILRNIEMCGGRIHINNLSSIRKCDGPIVFISNHMSTLETFVFPVLIAPVHKVTFVVKESLINYPIFGAVMRSRDPVVVKRKNPREDFETVMKNGKATLEKGISIIIFPQHTRSSEFKPAEFNSMGVKLAKSANVKVIPIAIKTDFWENGKYLKDFGCINRNLPIHIEFGDPMEIKGNGKKEHQYIVDFIQNSLAKWQKSDNL